MKEIAMFSNAILRHYRSLYLYVGDWPTDGK
jgi:hypothetical protein